MSKNNTPKPFKVKTNWTFLCVGDHGRTIKIKGFKGIFYIFLSLFIFAVAADAALFFISKHLWDKNKALESRLSASLDRIVHLEKDRDSMEASIVIPDDASHKKKGIPSSEAVMEMALKENEKDVNDLVVPEALPATGSNNATVEETSNRITEEGKTPKNLISKTISVEDFKVSPRAAGKYLNVNFNIRNIDTGSSKVSGHIVAVIKTDESKKHQWVSVPRIKLNHGRPSGKEQGESFSISRFKAIKLRGRARVSSKSYKTATVFIFSKTDELIHEESFDIQNMTN